MLVVDDDNKVQATARHARRREGEQVVVREWPHEGERVIVEGIQKVRPGMTVGGKRSRAPPWHRSLGQPTEG